ncbi:shikimate kinase [Rhodobacterales bacterium HKCCE3408]|nr:shikimate kinase [Rhodobacterales bacterium HKCCE3408]
MGGTLPTTRTRLNRTVVLVGMMGAGKSAIGRAIAAHLGVELKDSDAVIVERARMSIAEIFERDGEAFFRARETEVIRRLLEGPPCILSTGGGAWLSPGNREMISARAAVLWLKADLDLLWTRVRHRDTRPLLKTSDPRGTLARILAERTPHYEKAELVLEVRKSWSIAETTEAALGVLERAGVVEQVAA